MFGIGNDITEQKQSEQKIKMSEKKYRTLFNTMAQGVVYQDANDEIISANPAAEEILGLSLDQMKGRTSVDKRWRAVDKNKKDLPGEQHPAMIALRTGQKVSDFLMGIFNPKHNKYTWIIVNAVPEFKEGKQKPYQVFTTFLDETKRIHYEQEMKEVNSIINKSNHVTFTWKNDEHWSVEYVTENVERIFGYTKNEFITQTINYEACIHQDDIERVKNELERFISDPTKDELKHEPYRIITKEGKIKWVDDWSYIIRDEQGTITHYKGIIEDITKRKTAEIALQENQQSFKCLFENSQNGIVICELIKDEAGEPVDYIHLQVNPSTEKQLGHKPETLVNKTAKELIGDEKGLEYAQKNGGCVLTGKPYSWVDFVPFYERYLRMDSFSLKDDLFAITFIDISKEIIKEKQLTERVKELQGMKKLRETLEKSERYDTVFSEFVNDIVPKSMQYPDKTYAKIIFDGKIYCNHPSIQEEDILHLSEPIMVNQKERGKIIIGYIEELPFIEQYEDDLIWNYAEIFNDYIGRKESTIALRESEKRYRSYINNAPNAIFITDAKRNIIEVNDSFCRMSGYSKQELSTMKMIDLFDSDNPGSHGCFEVLDEQGIVSGEKCIIHKDGSKRWWGVNAVKLSDDRFLGFSQDITEKKAIKDQEKFLSDIVRTASVAIAVGYPDGRIGINNEAFQKLTGYTEDELKNVDWNQMTPEKWRRIETERLQELHGSKDSVRYEKEYIRKDGSIVPIEVMVHGCFDEQGEIEYYKAFITDISDRKESERALRESEEIFRQTFENATVGYSLTKPDGTLSKVNDAFASMLGYTVEELSYMNFVDVTHPDDIAESKECVRSLLAGEKVVHRFEKRFFHKNGSIIWADIGTTLLRDEHNNPLFFITSIQDITDKKHAEIQMKHSQKETDMVLNTAADGIRIVTKDFKIKTMNDTIVEMTNTTKEEGVGQYCYDVFKSNNCGTENCSMVKILRTGEGFEEEEIRINADGRRIPCISKITPYKDENNEIIGIIEDFRDITSLLETEAKFQNIFENKGTAMGMFGDDGVITLCNSRFEEISGFSKKEILGKMKWSDFVVKEDLERMMKYHRQRSEGGNPPSEYMCDVINKQGERKTMVVNIGVMPNSKERIVSLTDITKQKTAEKKLLNAHNELKDLNQKLEQKVKDRTQQIQILLNQKDEFINQLGHDIKNPLGPLVNLLPILEKKVNDPDQKEMIQVMSRNVVYVKNLVTRTIQLAQLKSPSTGLKYETIDLGKEVSNVLGNNQFHFNQRNISVDNTIPDGVMIDADRLKLQEVFNNLVNNAVKYSKDDGGNIIINQTVNDDDTLTVSVKDSGVGMTEVQLEKVFDEFYKADSSRHDFDSSGLGMAITKRIIELHGGKIWAESEGLDKGSTFYFNLPLHKKDD